MRSYLAFAFALSIIAGAPAIAMVQHTPGAHLNVLKCLPHRGAYSHNETYFDQYGNIFNRVAPGRPSTLEIHYVNINALTASEIDFGLVARNVLVAQVTDAGTFSPGILIDHEFDIPHEVFPLGTGLPQCVVLKVKYNDGSVWNNPKPPQP